MIDEKEFRNELNKFADICGLPNQAITEFDFHVDYLVLKYKGE